MQTYSHTHLRRIATIRAANIRHLELIDIAREYFCSVKWVALKTPELFDFFGPTRPNKGEVVFLFLFC